MSVGAFVSIFLCIFASPFEREGTAVSGISAYPMAQLVHREGNLSRGLQERTPFLFF